MEVIKISRYINDRRTAFSLQIFFFVYLSTQSVITCGQSEQSSGVRLMVRVCREHAGSTLSPEQLFPPPRFGCWCQPILLPGGRELERKSCQKLPGAFSCPLRSWYRAQDIPLVLDPACVFILK